MGECRRSTILGQLGRGDTSTTTIPRYTHILTYKCGHLVMRPKQALGHNFCLLGNFQRSAPRQTILQQRFGLALYLMVMCNSCYWQTLHHQYGIQNIRPQA